MQPSACPTADRLRLLLGDALPEQEQTDLTAHLEGCSACQHKLESLTGADPALLEAAVTLPRVPCAAEASLSRVLQDLHGDPGPTLPAVPSKGMGSIESLLAPAGVLSRLQYLDRYEVREVLGQGAMGIVLRAHEAALNRWVAIKVMVPDLADDPVARQRFSREARAAAAVRHEHVITIHAVSEVRGLPYLVMEYVEGGSLQDYLDLNGPPDWREVARLGVEVASGLSAAHARGLVHRDIKPSNILLVTDPQNDGLGRACIADFGLARAADEARITLTGTVLGTPMYMAPEQARCEPVDARADLFSLGSVLYTLSTGQELFPFGSPVAVLRQVCETMPRPVRELNPETPAWLSTAIQRLHAKDPADRFPSAAHLAELFRYNLAHPDRPRLLPPTRSPARRRARRRLLVWALLPLLMLTGGLILGRSLGWISLPWASSVAASDSPLPLRATLRGHKGPVWSVAFAPDGHTLVTGSDDTFLRFWEAATGQPLGELSGHGTGVLSVAFSHAGKFLLSGGSDGTLRVWDASSHSEQMDLVHNTGSLRRAPISPDDRTVAVASAHQGVELWDLDSQTIRRRLAGHQGTIQALAFSPDNKLLATGDTSGQIHFWDLANATEKASWRGDELGVRALAFSPDGKFLASAGTSEKDIKLWQVADGQRVATLTGCRDGPMNVAFSSDGRLIAAGSRGGSVTLWDSTTGQSLASYGAHLGTVWGVTFSPDSLTLATVGEDRLGKLWDLSGLRQARP